MAPVGNPAPNSVITLGEPPYDPTVPDPAPVAPAPPNPPARAAYAPQDEWETTTRRRTAKEPPPAAPSRFAAALAPVPARPPPPPGLMGISPQTCLDMIGVPNGDVFTENANMCNHWAHAMEGQQAQQVVSGVLGKLGVPADAAKAAGVAAGVGLLAGSEFVRGWNQVPDSADVGFTLDFPDLPFGKDASVSVTVFGPDRPKRGKEQSYAPSGVYLRANWKF